MSNPAVHSVTAAVTEHEDATTDPRAMVTGYRGEEVLRRTLDLGLGEVAYRLEPVATLIAPE